jgi:hypothetical protein
LDPIKQKALLKLIGRVRYLGVVIVLVCWLVGFLTDILGDLIHFLLLVALVMTIFIYFAGRYEARVKR